MRQPLVVSLALLGLGGCSFFGALAGGGAGGGLVMAVDMEKVDVDAIALELPGTPTTWCPGQSGSFTVVAQGTERRGGKAVTLRTAPEGTTGSALRGKMDLVEFAMAARGGTVERGVFTASGDPFAALLGYDLRATYRNETDETTVVHLDPVYGCIRGAGSSGLAGEWGEGGYAGSDAGQAGSAGGPGGNGGPGPRIVAYATLVRTPKYDRMGLLRIEGDVEQLTLFDPAEGITVIASGGVGGTGGSGGDGAQGADPQGQGGPGGPVATVATAATVARSCSSSTIATPISRNTSASTSQAAHPATRARVATAAPAAPRPNARATRAKTHRPAPKAPPALGPPRQPRRPPRSLRGPRRRCHRQRSLRCHRASHCATTRDRDQSRLSRRPPAARRSDADGEAASRRRAGNGTARCRRATTPMRASDPARSRPRESCGPRPLPASREP
ncbi:MAG: hypothetical protein U0168_02455 [Nannocystaceae bacterium]